MKLLPTHLSRTLAGFAATAAILVTLAGCSAPAETNGPTSASGGDGAVSDAAFQAARDAYDLKLAQCLRDKGLDVKDPEPGQGIQESSPEINEAASTCMTEIGDPPTFASSMSDAEALTLHLKWADCFRKAGFGVTEPTSGQAFVIPNDASDEVVAACTDLTL
ncbi:hypothetical protein [Cryobacterium sp. PAMC25264]|uniref:hypothetical protein n=1 Tax=Cryobacterium sp. PAMC25264 TaxID=2861288 RepID=UPI001C634615|nr:hypothetical protein [Cryobacterium sp. PAMC25264]QYF73179.1 hypothetical protein KY500_15740 [Cryobacterium sp. PAMC25264]